MSDHLADEIERMNTRWMPLVAERLWLCSQADSQVALRRRVMAHFITSMDKETDEPNGEWTDCHQTKSCLSQDIVKSEPFKAMK